MSAGRWRGGVTAVLVVASFLVSVESAALECTILSFGRTACRTNFACVRGNNQLFLPLDASSVHCEGLAEDETPESCSEKVTELISLFKGVTYQSEAELRQSRNVYTSAVIVPAYPFSQNIYHFGRGALMALHVAWNAGLYSSTKPDYVVFMNPSETVNRNDWNAGFTTLLNSEVDVLPMPATDDEVICFEQSVLLGSAGGYLFPNFSQPVVTESELHDGSHLPFVPVDVIRFRNLMSRELFLQPPTTGVEPLPEKLMVQAPPKIMSLNVRRGERASKRSFTKAGQARFLAITRRIAANYGLELKTVAFEGLPFADQVKAMADTGIVVGIHGANLMNTIFMPTLSSVLEVLPRYYLQRTYHAGGNSGLKYANVESDDPDIVFCEFSRDIACQKYLRVRQVKLSGARWLELARKLRMSAAYLSILHKQANSLVELVREGDGYRLTDKVRDEILDEWQRLGYTFDRASITGAR
mmetsp:Transcript_4524/g.13720  ORF Transcript_4524/g.13720 Transcript_4524/m.13720 type:complete len:471 (+) Transcript_4524:123-1535(+)